MQRKKTVSFILILQSYVIFSCGSDNHRAVQTLGEYDIPIQHDTISMIYTYRDSYGNISKNTFGFYHHNGTVRIMQYVAANDVLMFERFYKVTGNKKEFVEEYFYDEDTSEKVKGEIKTYKDYNDGRPYRTFEVEVSFTNEDGFRKSFQEKFIFLKDTTITWNGEVYPAIKFSGEMRENKVIKYFPIYGRPFEYSGVFYYAKGIGQVKSILTEDSHRVESELISIQRVPQRNAVTMAMLRRRNF